MTLAWIGVESVCQDTSFCLAARIHENPKSIQANLSRHPGRRIYPGQVRIAWSGYNPPVSLYVGWPMFLLTPKFALWNSLLDSPCDRGHRQQSWRRKVALP